MTEERTRQLTFLFEEVLKGKKTAASNNPKLFLEAICMQTPAVTCISRLVASSYGLEALLHAFSSDTSLSFLNGQLTAFLEYIKRPDFLTVGGGSLIWQVLAKLIEAPLTWKNLVKAAQDQTLNQRALNAFAWLLIQLLSLPVKEAICYLRVAQDPAIQRALTSSSHDVGVQGQRIIRIAKVLAGYGGNYILQGPGGRHDNDFSDIKRISIYPTQDELKLRMLDVYLPKAYDVQKQAQDPEGLTIHIDSQFRLLREDMLCELREELKTLVQLKEWRRRTREIKNLALTGVYCNERFPWLIELTCKDILPLPQEKSNKERQKLLQDILTFLKHGIFVCLFVDNEFLTLGTVQVQEEDLLIQSPGIPRIQILTPNTENVLMQLKNAGSTIRLLQIDTAIFAYEPVLKQLQKIQMLSLTREIITWKAGISISPPEYLSGTLKRLLQDLREDYSCNLQPLLQLEKPTRLDKTQAECFQAAFKQKVVLIQGPPGTGKSFIGSLVGKAIYLCSNEKMLVVCYTHHALDDFLEDLLNLGIPSNDIVRLGATHKATDTTKSLALKEYKQGIKFTREQWNTLNARKVKVAKHAVDLKDAFNKFVKLNSSHYIQDLYEFLKSCDDKLTNLQFYKAFHVPIVGDGLVFVGKRGEMVDKYYLINQWMRGKDAGIFRSQVPCDCHAVWQLTHDARKQKCKKWYHEMIKKYMEQVCQAGKQYNDVVKEVNAFYLLKDLAVMRNKRIIACTTTAAAKYSDIIQSVSPSILLVEEAGEILESHVLTALGSNTKHLILIGDHKQLRPKVNHELSVEKGTGYDLNRSLFERLILKGFPYQTLFSQHRMRPEISALVREMTYPELKDAKDTQGRPNLRGFINNVIFVNHNESETEISSMRKLEDSKAMSSKQNLFEAKMTLKCVRYLGQQGYRTHDIVVLTPYLGQLQLLYDELKVDNDPVLNDLDSHDLIHAGLIPKTTAQVNKPRLRISTIDNFQGEEANIVVASLTRSNTQNDIGFMFAPERLNVLVSRARNALILIGNAEHFMGSRKGGDLWKRFIGLLKANMHFFNGFPIRCERHPDRTAILQKPTDFDTECPDGGCKKPCNKILNCGIHGCPDRCHMLSDHSNIKCKALISFRCNKGHVNSRLCHVKAPSVCAQCKIESEKTYEEAQRKLQAGKKQVIVPKQKENNLQIVEDVARIKLASNKTPNSVSMGIYATPAGAAQGSIPKNQWQHLLQRPEVERTIEKIGVEQKKRDWQTAKDVAEKKLVFNDVPNALPESKNTVQPVLDLTLQSQSQHLLQMDHLVVRKINATKTAASKQQAVLKQKTSDVLASGVAGRKLTYTSTAHVNVSKPTPYPAQNSEWQHSLQRANIFHENQVIKAKAVSSNAATQQAPAIKQNKKDFATTQDVAMRKSAFGNTSPALIVSAKDAGPKPNRTPNAVNQPQTKSNHKLLNLPVDCLQPNQAVWRASTSNGTMNILVNKQNNTFSPSNSQTKLQTSHKPMYSTNIPNLNVTSSIEQKVYSPGIRTPRTKETQGFSSTTTLEGREPGVSDEIWQQLQHDIAAQKEQKEQASAELRRQKEVLAQVQLIFEISRKQLKEAEESSRVKAEESHRQQELSGIGRILSSFRSILKIQRSPVPALRAKMQAVKLNQIVRDAELCRLNDLEKAQLSETEQEQQTLYILQRLPIYFCIARLQWIKQSDGYRCSGGGHFVSNEYLKPRLLSYRRFGIY